MNSKPVPGGHVKIFFPGDKVRFTLDGNITTGVIEDFTHDLTAIRLGLDGDTAMVRCAVDDLVAVSCTELEAAGS